MSPIRSAIPTVAFILILGFIFGFAEASFFCCDDSEPAQSGSKNCTECLNCQSMPAALRPTALKNPVHSSLPDLYHRDILIYQNPFPDKIERPPILILI